MSQSPNLKALKIVKFDFKALGDEMKEVNLVMNSEISYRLPKEEEITRVMLEYTTSIHDREFKYLSLELEAKAIFTIEKAVGEKELEEIVKGECTSILLEQLSEKVGTITETMGFAKVPIQ